MKRALLVLVAALAVAHGGCGDAVTATPEGAPASADFAWPEGDAPTVVLHVRDRGAIEIALHPELAPASVEHFLRLAREGYYDGTAFHRVIPGFMIQGGDPNSRDRDPSDDGMGGLGFRIPDEFSNAPHQRGVVSMANTGQPDSGGSQFFIVHRDSRQLDGHYTVIGRVTSGLDVVDAIAAVETDLHGRWGPRNRPIESVVVEKVEVRPAG